LVQVSSLTKRYGSLTTLREVSFSIRPGEVLGLIGPNGSGKTTLFECLGGVLPADGGALLGDARPLTASERTAAVFYLPDLITPWPSQTVRWALDFVRGYWGQVQGQVRGQVRGQVQGQVRGQVRGQVTGHWGQVPGEVLGERGQGQDWGQVRGQGQDWGQVRGQARGQVRGLTPDPVRHLDLEPLMDVRMDRLSKGQRKRALLAIGLLTPQPILLADEPFDGLDLRQTREVALALRHFAAAGRTMVLSIHQIADAARVCDRFVLLSGGRTRGEGTIDELSALAGAAPGTALEEIFLALT
jgi:ABC-type multidrug transport system ATPase subunit